ncbi:MAG: beta-ketoacyl synthase N-terminal-like domain-containing protein, partial [Microcoleus sp.]
MEKIAVVGFSCLFPNANNPEDFWQNLIDEKDTTSLATVEEIGVNPAIFYDSVTGKPDKTYSLKGGFIRDFQFDPTGYNLSPEVLETIDPIGQGTLYVAKQALVHSHYWGNSSALSRCGAMLGNLSSPTQLSYRCVAPVYQQVIEPAMRELLQNEHFRLEAGATQRGAFPYNAMSASLPSWL